MAESTNGVNKVNKFAIVGVGSRASFYYSAITKDFPKVTKLVAFCDPNQTRMDFANKALAEYNHLPVPTYKDDQFDKMMEDHRPD